jgi:hypothetical protein
MTENASMNRLPAGRARVWQHPAIGGWPPFALAAAGAAPLAHRGRAGVAV